MDRPVSSLVLVAVATLSCAGEPAPEETPPADTMAQASPAAPQSFAVHIENVSTPATLQLSDGTSAPAPTAPVLWVVHTSPDPIFTTGQADRGDGLEQLAEDGDPSVLAAALQGADGVVAGGFVNVPMGDAEAGPITPGKAYHVDLMAARGQRLTLAMMFGQSNDLFYAPEGAGLDLFDAAGQPFSGEVTSRLVLWDAGTESNQEPGAGPDQAPRQKAPNTGAAEGGTVRLVDDDFTYPAVEQVVRVTIRPAALASGTP
ncbi:MAG TPA: spondin domain-containing protein [Gemmatimonadota bacterium]|nr:spondin domain-containing protein [Gemmatimonadota bacterium]